MEYIWLVTVVLVVLFAIFAILFQKGVSEPIKKHSLKILLVL